MKQFRSMVVLVVLFGALLSPGQAAVAQSDGDALCLQAASGGVDGYAVVYGSGGSGSQVVLGTDGGETLSGGSGNDILCGFGGDDVLLGGSGNDILVGGPGQDELYGESGGDTLYGDTDDPVLSGGTGNNRVFEAQVGPAFTYTLGPVNESSLCAISFSLTNGPRDAAVGFRVDAVAPDADYTVEIFERTDEFGNASETSGDVTIPRGYTTTGASVSNVSVSPSVLIATAPGGQTCGDTGI